MDAATHAFRSLLTPTQWQAYRTQAKNYVEGFLHSAREDPNWDVSLDIIWARRWVCRRAHQYGWTAERFAEIDDALSSERAGRRDHRIERIGKKYQWMALSELAARLGDNACFLGRRGARDEGETYRGAYAHL